MFSKPMPMFATSGLDSIALAAAQLEDEKNRESKNIMYNVSELENPSCSIPTKSSQTESKMKKDETIIINRNDVLCGRGGETNHHPGNVQYRRLVKTHQRAYLEAKRRDKPRIAKIIVDQIRNQNPSGRFLKKIGSGDQLVWQDVGNVKAREKTSQALREGAPEIRDKFETKSVTNNSTYVAYKELINLCPNGTKMVETKCSQPMILQSRHDIRLGPRVVSNDHSFYSNPNQRNKVLSNFQTYSVDNFQLNGWNNQQDSFQSTMKRKRPISIEDTNFYDHQENKQVHSQQVDNGLQYPQNNLRQKLSSYYDIKFHLNHNEKKLNRGPRIRIFKSRMRMEIQAKHKQADTSTVSLSPTMVNRLFP